MSPFEFAQQQRGLASSRGIGAVRSYLQSGGQNLDPATAAWCAAFLNSTLQQTGHQGSGSNMARSFLNVGQPVDQPQIGDIAVTTRGNPNGPYGHVGFFNGYDDSGRVKIFAGNTSKDVGESAFDPKSVLGFRRLGDGAQTGDFGGFGAPFSWAGPTAPGDAAPDDTTRHLGALLAMGGGDPGPAQSDPEGASSPSRFTSAWGLPEPQAFDANRYMGLLGRRRA